MPSIEDYLRLDKKLTKAERDDIASQLTEDKRSEFAKGWFNHDEDQPVKVVPIRLNRSGREELPPSNVEGYFCQLKAILGKTPEEIEGILGIYGLLSNGAYVMRIDNLLLPGFYSNKAYTHLPGGERYRPTSDPSKNPYRPGKAVGQWKLSGPVGASMLAKLRPGDRFSLKPVNYGRTGE